MNEKMTPVEMYNELVQMGYVVPASIEPNAMMTPTAYISVPSTLNFFTPPVSVSPKKEGKNAELGLRAKGNLERKGRRRRRVSSR